MQHKIFRLLLIGTMILANVLIGLAQNPMSKPKKQRTEITAEEAYKRFLNEDVPYIITDAEKEAFLKLKTNEERENFIETFWRRRDPNPDTEENEYREEYYERIAYANEKFTSGMPGWKTDRGRIYIARGKPDSIESHPSGGSYDRPSYEGGGSTTTYPFEVWFYRNVDGVGSGIEIEFVDPTGTGEYRIARNANEKDALLYIPGAGQTWAEQLGIESRANRISGLSNNFQREQDSPFRRQEILVGMTKPPQVNDTTLLGLFGGNTGTVEDLGIDFDLRVDFFRQSDEKVVATFTIQTENKELNFNDIGGIPTAKMNILGRITQVSGKRTGIFEDAVTTTETAENLANKNHRSSIYQKTFILLPGTYKTEVAVRDVETGKKGLRSLGFTVPKYEAEKLSTSTLILASRLSQTTEKDIGGMFVIGDKKVIPNLAASYKKGQEVGIYMQVYNAGIDQMTLKPAVDVEYILLKDGKEIARQNEDWKGLSDAGQRLVLARFIPTEKLVSGEYELKVKIQDRVNNQTLEPTAKFKVSE